MRIIVMHNLDLGHWFSSTLLLFASLSNLYFAICQKLPTARDEDHFKFNINQDRLFYDRKVIPDGYQVTSYLLQDVEKKFFFPVEEDDTPFSITLSPCTSKVERTLYLLDPLEPASGDGIDNEDDVFNQKENLRPKQEDKPGLLVQKIFGNDIVEYTIPNSPAGIYMLTAKATQRDTNLQIYATTTPDSDHAFPQLPSDPSVQIAAERRHSITINWKPSPSDSSHGQKVEYCVLVSQDQNFKTHCGAKDYVFGQAPPTPPPFSGFGFSWEKKKQQTILNLSKPMEAADPKKVFYKCVGTNNVFTFEKKQPGKQYYVDVFAVNSANNMSATYNGTSFKTRTYNKTISLKEGKVASAFLKRLRDYKLYRYQLDKSTKELQIVVQPCSTPLVVEISKRRKVLKRIVVRKLKIFKLERAKSGVYFIKVSSRKRKSTSYRILVANRGTRLPYPDLPKDTRIKVFDNLKTCNSVTLAWLGTEKRLSYCLYKKQLDISAKRQVSTPQNMCIETGSRKKTEKVVCKNFKYRNKKRSVMTEVVGGLLPNATYIFDVYVKQRRGLSLPYQSVIAGTMPVC